MKPAFLGKTERKAALAAARPPLRIALAGYGVVGQALAAKLDGDSDFELVAILVRMPGARGPSNCRWHSLRPRPSSRCRPFIIVEVVVRCDRRLFRACAVPWRPSSAPAKGDHQLPDPATERPKPRRPLLHSAAVGGGTPVLGPVAEARGRATVAVDGILHGTVNYILRRQAARSFAGLAGARSRCRENPAEDLSGADAAGLRLIAAG